MLNSSLQIVRMREGSYTVYRLYCSLAPKTARERTTSASYIVLKKLHSPHVNSAFTILLTLLFYLSIFVTSLQLSFHTLLTLS